MELLRVDTIEAAREKLVNAMQEKKPNIVRLDLLKSLGHILAQDVIAQEPVPSFRRSTVDGYAVVSGNTAGASESLPVLLEMVEEVSMGHPSCCPVKTGTCGYVPTGGMIPEGADAMVMEEYCEIFDENHLAVYCPVAHGKDVVSQGEDIREGELVIKKGTRIRPQEIGVMASLGIMDVMVYEPWTITIFSTGDELVHPSHQPAPGEIRDINSYALSAQAETYGLKIQEVMVCKDDQETLKGKVSQLMKISDLVIISGGSSKGKKDATSQIIDEVTDGHTLIHGLALKPGKPSIFGYDQSTATLVTGLPGHPVAAMLVFDLLIIWLYKYMTSQKEGHSLFARMTTNLAGSPGRTTCQLVRLIKKEQEYYAEPVHGKSGLITSLTRADGYLMIGQNQEGLNKDELVEVFYV
ncbi:molybdopterin molybdotransferase MoeA [Lacrimispora algidixylanolytica]|uniref:Molybdopterin molybdenumtransferase n=1 Tax=Lacrimispora algidixylanolytica TaxID=94868 RepID=A0A419T0X8_9FIRM|nr:gephyrin-like molybdotransferase Glp [Lacrimispora algidixylanolytica]RKD31079.1 molybdopterin molybdenumtransferase MoeA [Lacrimispora algidixylanolytica]